MSKRQAKTFPFGDNGECFRNLKGSEIAEFLELQEKLQSDDKALVDVYAYIMCKCLCNSEGERVFTDAEMDECREQDFGELKTLAETVMDNIGLVDEIKN